MAAVSRPKNDKKTKKLSPLGNGRPQFWQELLGPSTPANSSNLKHIQSISKCKKIKKHYAYYAFTTLLLRFYYAFTTLLLRLLRLLRLLLLFLNGVFDSDSYPSLQVLNHLVGICPRNLKDVLRMQSCTS